MATKYWAIADLHFGHKNIIIPDRVSRPHREFESIEEMDNIIVRNWNKVVSKYDKVFVLGDVSFHDKEKTKEIISGLNGHKILVKGNHDKRSNDFYMEAGFKEVSKYPIIIEDAKIIMSHSPIDSMSLMHGYKNYHGHMHSMVDEFEGRNPYKYKCFSVENIGYMPRRIAIDKASEMKLLKDMNKEEKI